MNDLEGTVVREKIYHEAGAHTDMHMPYSELVRLIRGAGKRPVERDSLYRPVREVFDDPPPPAGVPVAIGTDFNPGTSPTPSLPFVMTVACLELRLTPSEALAATTINAAAALAAGAADAVHGHRLCAVFAQVHGAQLAVGAQGMRGVAVIVCAQLNRLRIPLQNFIPQAHRALVGNEL